MAKTPARCPALSRYQASEAGATRRGCRYPRLLSPHASSCPLTAMEKQSWRAGLASLAHLATGVAGPRRGLGNCCGIQGSSRGPQVWAGCRGGSDSLSQENDSATCWGAAGRSWVMHHFFIFQSHDHKFSQYSQSALKSSTKKAYKAQN